MVTLCSHLYGLVGGAPLLACAGCITRAGGKLLKRLLALSKHSYAIYLAHPLVLYFAESYVLSHMGWTPWLSIPLVIAAVLLPHGLALLLRETRLAPMMLGQGSRMKPNNSPQVVSLNHVW